MAASFFSLNLFSQQDYYISELNGNDGNDGLTIQTAWKTIQNLPTNLVSGSSVLFERGGIYRGEIYYGSNKANGVTFGAYGSGNKPKLKGSVRITGWIPTVHPSLGSNVYEADVSGLLYDTSNGIQHLFVDDKIATIARYPNVSSPKEVNWLTVEANTGSTSFSDSELANYGKPDGYWIGATLRIRSYSWSFRVGEITGYNSSNGKITSSILSNQKPEWGYFIDGKLEELDYPGEWFFDDVAQKIYYYPLIGHNPNNLLIEGATYNNVVKISGCNNVEIENVALDQCLNAALSLSMNASMLVKNCNMSNNNKGVSIYKCNDFIMEDSELIDNYNESISVLAPSTFNVGFSEIRKNLIKNSGVYSGYAKRYDGIYSNAAISIFCNDYRYVENVIDSCGWNGINLKKDNNIIKNNIVKNALLLLNDGGAINISGGSDNNVIDGNILLNSFGNVDDGSNGWSSLTNQHRHPSYAQGLGSDSNPDGNIIINNTIANNQYWGIRMNNFKNSTVSNNIVYGNSDQIVVQDHKTASFGHTITNNVCYSLN